LGSTPGYGSLPRVLSMSDVTEYDLLATIRDDPADPGPRLVFADWLAEHGQPERAEFVRGSDALTRLRPDDPARAILQARLRAPWREHGGDWARPRVVGLVHAHDAAAQGGFAAAPRVRICKAGIPDEERPFVLGVVADLAGFRDASTPPYRKRRFAAAGA